MASCQLDKPTKLISNQKSHQNIFGDTKSGKAQQSTKTCTGMYNQRGHEQGSHTLVSYQSQCHSQTIMHHQPMPWNDKINHHQTAHGAANSQSHCTSLMRHQPILFDDKISSHQISHGAKHSHSQSIFPKHHQTMHFNDVDHDNQIIHDSISSQSHSLSPMQHQSIHIDDNIYNHQTDHAATIFQSHFPSLMHRQPIHYNDGINSHQTAHAVTNCQSHCTYQGQGQHAANRKYHATACHGKNDKRFKEKIAEGKEIVKSLIKKKYRDSRWHDNNSSSDSEDEGDVCPEKVNHEKTYHISWTISRNEKQTSRSN